MRIEAKKEIIGRCGFVCSYHFDRNDEVDSKTDRFNLFNKLHLLCDNSLNRNKEYGYMVECKAKKIYSRR